MTRAPGLERLIVTGGALALALAPHVAHLPPWISAAFAGTLAWRLLAEQRGWALPPRAVRSVATLGATLAVLASYRTLNGLDAGSALLAVMACLKLLETRAPRDHAVLVFVGYLLCLATLLYGESLARLVYVLIAAWLLTAALARVHRPIEANTAVRPVRLAARLLALGLPLAVALFLFVPRIEGRFWTLPSAAPRHTTGLSDEMSPGDVASLSLSDDPAFRAWFRGPPPPPEQRYWRVVVLEGFDGRRWRRAPAAAERAEPQVEPGGTRYDYRIVLEPTQREWLPGLDTVVAWPHELALRGRSLALVHIEPTLGERVAVTTALDYSLRSAVGSSIMASALPADVAARDLQLPAARAPRARALAATLRAASRDERDYIGRVLSRFRNEPFEYTLEPPPLGAEPVDEFLFGTRQGFCEHYASAFAVLTRAAGIPTRVVTGYQGGEPNSYGGYLLVRQSSAHAWDEVWLAGAGWLRVDPTAAVAPERIRRDVLSLGLRRSGTDLLFADIAWLARVREAWDAARSAWNTSVVHFNTGHQQRLLEMLGLGGRGWQGLAVALAATFAIAAVALGAWLAWELRPRTHDPLAATWNDVCAQLAAAGLPRAPAEGPLAYARRVATARPALGPEFSGLADAYVAARYLPGATVADGERLRALARGFGARLRGRRR